MKKAILTFCLITCALAASAAHKIVIETSCGYEVTMEYQDYHNMNDVMHDAMVLENALCS